MAFENITDKIQDIADRAQGYVESSLHFYKLKVFKASSKLTISLLQLIIYGGLFLFILLFLSMGAAFWLGTYFKHVFVGFLLIGGFYILLLIFMFIFGRKLIERKILSQFSELFFDEDDSFDPQFDVEHELERFENLISEEIQRRENP